MGLMCFLFLIFMTLRPPLSRWHILVRCAQEVFIPFSQMRKQRIREVSATYLRAEFKARSFRLWKSTCFSLYLFSHLNCCFYGLLSIHNPFNACSLGLRLPIPVYDIAWLKTKSDKMCHKNPVVSSQYLSTPSSDTILISHVPEQNSVLSNLFNITGKTFIEQLLYSRHVRCEISKYLLRGLGASPWMHTRYTDVAGNFIKRCILFSSCIFPSPVLQR